MHSEISNHDRTRAWFALRRRAAEASTLWWEPQVDAAIMATAREARFDALLVESAIESWNDTAHELYDAVLTSLAGCWPGHDRTIGLYVSLNLYDWLMLPSTAAMGEFVACSLELYQKWGLRRDLFDQKFRSEMFHSDRPGVPRVVLRDVDGGTMVDFVDRWPHDRGFTAVSAITDSAGELIVLDVQARNEGMINQSLLRDIETLCGRWRALLAGYRANVYQVDMNISHNGIEPFPG